MEGNDVTIFTINHLCEMQGSRWTESKDLLVFRNAHLDDVYHNRAFRAREAAVALCAKGSCEIVVNLQRFMMTEGSVVMYGTDAVVEFCNRSSDLSIYAIICDKSLVEETLIDLKAVIPIVKYIKENTANLLVLNDEERYLLVQFYDLIYAMVPANNGSIIRDLLAAFLRTLGELYSRRLQDDIPQPTRQEEYFERFMRKVARNHQRERSVKYYADALHITPKYLSTIIKEISGKSATAWINDFVIQEAKVLLRFSGKSVQEITYHLNFSTQSFFGKYFKRHTGMSPSEYRQSQ